MSKLEEEKNSACFDESLNSVESEIYEIGNKILALKHKVADSGLKKSEILIQNVLDSLLFARNQFVNELEKTKEESS